MKFLSLATVFVALLSQIASAEVQIKNWIVSGTKDCRKENVQILGNGNAFSILFNQFGPNLNANDRQGRVDLSACYIGVLLELPAQRCIDRMDQVLSGGVIKSKNTTGYFYALARLNGLTPVKSHANFLYGKEIRPEDAESILLFQSSKNTVCTYARYQWYTLEMLFAANRRNESDFFIGNIDGADAEVSVKVRTR